MTKKEALEVLGCSYNTFRKMIKQGRIRYHHYSNGRRNYWEDDVYGVVGRKVNRNHWIVAYSRVNETGPTGDPKVEQQKQRILSWALARGVRIDQMWEDRSPGTVFNRVERPALFQLLDSCLRGEVDCIIVETRCRLARIGFDVIQEMLRYHSVELIVLNEIIEDSYYKEEQASDLAKLIEWARNERVGGKRQQEKTQRRNRSTFLGPEGTRVPLVPPRHPGLPGTEGLPV